MENNSKEKQEKDEEKIIVEEIEVSSNNILRASMGYLKENQLRSSINFKDGFERQSNQGFLRGSHNAFIQTKFNQKCVSDSDSDTDKSFSDLDDLDELRVTKSLVTEKYKYLGEVKNGKRDGFGVCYYVTGDKYVGYWSEDNRSGYGRYTKKQERKIYCGEYSENIIDGFAEYTNQYGIVFLGYMRNDKFILGEPLIMKSEKCKFEGRVRIAEGKLMGIGCFKYHFGGVYEGEICDYQESGLAIFNRGDGYIFKGENKLRNFSGYCEVTKPDKSFHFGFYKNNLKNGIVFSLDKEGNYSAGFYSDDILNGGYLTITKESKKFEIWLYGFLVKSIETKENIIKYISSVYPEYLNLLRLKNKAICAIFKN